MRTKEEIQELIGFINSRQERAIQLNEEEITAAYEKTNGDQSLAVKILSMFGGIFASCIFVGFLFLVGLYDSELAMLIVGILLITSGIFINKATESTIVDTVSISAYIVGYILVGMGLSQMELDQNAISIIFILISAATLYSVQTYIISFVSVSIISGAFITLLISNQHDDLIHIYVSLMALLVSFVYLKEAKLMMYSEKFSKLYNPIRIALLFSFLAGLIILGKINIAKISSEYIWISSVCIIAAILYLISHLFELLNIQKNDQKRGIYAVSLLILFPTIFSPAISGALLIILLSFLVNYKTSLVIGIIAFIYFICQYYYDLHYTLLTKSIVLFCSGVLFLGLYFLTYKKLK